MAFAVTGGMPTTAGVADGDGGVDQASQTYRFRLVVSRPRARGGARGSSPRSRADSVGSRSNSVSTPSVLSGDSLGTLVGVAQQRPE